MVFESWESVQGNLNVPLYLREALLVSACEYIACTEALVAELMNVSGLWNLNERKVEELICLLVFVWSPRSER